jgi:hypothetical protein
MDWGHPHVEATYPSREKQEVQLFDVKEFTKKKKSDKIKNSLNEKGSSPFPSGSGSSNPFRGPSDIDFGAKSDMDSPFGAPKADNGGGLFGGLGGGIDLDAMMRDIDKKIAELDAEEARQKEEQAKLKEQKAQEDKKEDIKPVDSNKILGDLPKKEEFDFDFDLPDIKELSNDTSIKEEKIEDIKPIKPELNNEFNIFNTSSFDFDDIKDKEEKKSNEISLGAEKANVAVATSSPMDDDDAFDILPKVESASIIKPNYNSNTVVKANEESYNIYNDVPNLMENIKKDIEPKEELVKDTIEISKDKVQEVSNKLNSYNIFEEEKPNVIKYNSNDAPDNDGRVIKYETEPNEFVKQEKTNVNVDPDKIVIDSNTISDDAFFDDFFGDDE